MPDVEEQIPVKDFAARIKEKYPEYKDIDDNVLAQKMVEKYPEYKSQVVFDTVKKKEPTPLQSSFTQLQSVLQEGGRMATGQSLGDIKPTKEEILSQPSFQLKEPKGTVMSQIPKATSNYLPQQKELKDNTTVVPQMIQHKVEKPFDFNSEIDRLAATTTESPEHIIKRIDDGDLIPNNETGKLEERGNWLQNVGQGIKNTMDDIGLYLNITDAERKRKEGKTTGDGELKYILNDYNEKKKNQLETTYDANGDFFKALPKEIGQFAPYIAAGAVAPMADAPLMGMSSAGQSAHQIWNDKKLTEEQKVNAIKSTVNDQAAIGTLQMAAFHGLGITDKAQAKELLSKYVPTGQLFDASKNVLKALPVNLAKVAATGAIGQALSNVSQSNAGLDVDWKNVPESAKNFVKMDLVFKAPQLFMAGLNVLSQAREIGVDRENPQWFNKYNESVQQQLNTIVSSPENVYKKLIAQLDQYPNEQVAINAKQKIEEFRKYHNQLPTDLSPTQKDKALHLFQLKTDAVNSMNEAVDESIKNAYQSRAKAYDGQLQKIMDNEDKEPMKLLEYPSVKPIPKNDDNKNKPISVLTPEEVKQNQKETTTIETPDYTPETKKSAVSVILPKTEKTLLEQDAQNTEESQVPIPSKSEGNTVEEANSVEQKTEKPKIITSIKVHDRDVDVPLLGEYKGRKIVDINGDIHVYDPQRETLFNVALDDSKTSGDKKIVSEANNIESAKKYIDWSEGARKEGQKTIDISQPTEEGKGNSALKVYHGTPHGFEKFDISKLGSGEGAQAFGHGLYFTNDKGIAEGYANKLSSKKNFWEHLMDGNDISMSKEDFYFVKKDLDALGYDGNKAENANVTDVIIDGKSKYAPEVYDALSVLFGKNARKELEGTDLTTEEIDRLFEIKKKISNPKLYTAEIKNGDYIDWHSPLSDAQKSKLSEINTNGNGEQIYKELSKKLGSDKKASEYLESKGIDGIIYKTNKGTGGQYGNGRNYVVFNHDNISVKEINGEKHPTTETNKPISEGTEKENSNGQWAKDKKEFTSKNGKQKVVYDDKGIAKVIDIKTGEEVSKQAEGEKPIVEEVSEDKSGTGEKEVITEEHIKEAQSKYDAAKAKFEKTKKKIEATQAQQGGIFGGEQKGMFGMSGDEAKRTLDPLRKAAKEAKAELEDLQNRFEVQKTAQEPELFNPQAPVPEEKVFTQNALIRSDARKIHGEFKRVLDEVPATDARQIAISYLAGKGTVGERAINDIAGSVKRARLNTGEREFKSNEAKARDYYDANNKNSIDEIAHSLWESNGQEVSEMDIKNELMAAISAHNTRLEAAKEYINSYSADAAEARHQQQFIDQHADEVETEYKALEKANAEDLATNKELEQSDEHINNLIKQYEAEYGKQNNELAPEGEGKIAEKVSGRTSPEKAKETNDLGSKARDLAAKLRSGEKSALPDWLKADLPKGTKKSGISFDDAAAAALEAFAKSYDKFKNVAEAIKEAIKHIKDWYDENGHPFDEKEWTDRFINNFTEDTFTGKDNDIANAGRRFTKQMLRDEELSTESKAEIAKTLDYATQTNAMSIKEASETISKLGADEAYNLVVNGDVQPAVRVVMGQALIKKFNELSKDAKDEATKNYYLDRTIQAARFVTEKLATEPGQMIQAFSLYSRLSPEAQLRDAIQDQQIQANTKKRQRQPDVDNIANKFKKVNEEAAEEITKDKEVNSTVDKIDSERTKKAKAKIEKAKKTRENLIKKYKNDKGKNLYSTVGLTTEGIEFVGEVAKTYLDEGIANLDILAEKIINHLKEVSGKDVSDEIKKQVSEIADKAIDKSDKKLIGGELKSQKLKINDIIKKHYTVVEKIKQSLSDKLVEQAGLEGEEAKELATKVQEAFDRIANRKKRDILYNEKARFEKIQRGLQGSNKVEPKTLQSEMIRYSNMGAFDNAEMMDMIADKLGLGKITSDQAKKITELSDKIEKAPEGSPKNDATEDLLAYRAKIKGTSWADMAQGMWYANVLSGDKTHKKNVVSTFFNAMSDIGTEMIKHPKDIPFLFVGGSKGLLRGIWSAAHTTLTGRSPIHISKVETPNVLERVKFIGGAFNPFNWLKYVTRVMVAEDVLQFQGLKEARAYQLAATEARTQGYKNPFSKQTWDKVNELLLNTKERAAEAEAQVKEEGLQGVEAKRRKYELMENSRPIQMVEDSYGFAAHGTFNHETEGTLGALSMGIANAVNIPMGKAGTPLRFIVPFTRIITNVANIALDYTPVGMIRGIRGVRGFEGFKNTQMFKKAYVELTPEQRKSLIVKSSLGIATTLSFAALQNSGIIQITGAGPADLKKKLQLQEEGWQPYSIKYKDKWYSYQYTPMAIMLGFLGNMTDAAQYMDEEDVLKRTELAALKFGDQIAEMTWINSASTFLGALTEPKADEAERKLNNVLTNTAKGFIPFSNAITQRLQSYQEAYQIPQKQANTAWEKIKSDIPIARNSLNDKINALGEPVIRQNELFTSKEKDDEVWKFLTEHKGWIAPISKKSLIVFDGKTNQDRPVTDNEYYEFSKLRGKKIKDGIKDLMKNGVTETNEEGDEKTIPASKLKPKQLNAVLEQIKTKATKETKDEMFNPEGESKPRKTLKVTDY